MDLSLKGSQINLVSRHKPKALNVKYTPALQRPGSASVFRRGRTSPFLKRPQSADAKYSRCFGGNYIEGECSGKLVRNKRYLSVSSSNLLKILLDEPIKRSWLCRDQSDDQHSEASTSRKSCSINNLNRSRKDSLDISSQEGDTISTSQQLQQRMNPSSSLTNICKEKPGQAADFWHTKKPDLPGRVSFSKASDNALNVDFFSDCENDKQSFYGSKKSVHFGASSEVQAETFEYPKCPSDNCSCSTRSSSTASIHDSPKKCEYPDQSSCSTSAEKSQNQESESDVIRQYKHVIGEQSSECSSIVKNILQDLEPKRCQLNNMEPLPSIGHYVRLEKQNNFSDVNSKNSTVEMYRQTKRNLVLPSTTTPDAPSSESVINNYLKVTASPIVTTKKRSNNRPSSASKERRSKSAPGTEKRLSSQIVKNKRVVGPYREDSNLDEFQLDKVDSWMSAQVSEDRVVRSDLEKFSKDSIDGDEESSMQDSSQSSKSDENSQDDSTYEEIVSVIKEIEEDKKKDNLAEKSVDSDLKLNAISQHDHEEAEQSTSSNNAKSPDKYRDILSYLDDVENSCDKTLLETRRSIPESNRSEIEFVVEPDIAEDVPKLSDLLMLPNHQLARRVIGLSLRANELANAMLLSKEHIIKIRNEKQKGIRSEKQNTANRLREQKKHFEGIVARHQGFIEQLLKDKGSLCEKVAALTRRLESQNQAWEHKLETEVARVKETTLAGEKIRRERWVRDNTKKIKELTVKGLEMEINKMTCDHQREITELKRAHQQQLLDAVDEARIKHDHIENTIRETCAQDREAIIEKERAAIRDRYERQLQEERTNFDEQKAKLCEEFASERERYEADLKDKENEMQRKKLEMQREKEDAVENATSELIEKMSKIEEKYQNRVNSIEKQYETDFEIWKKEYENDAKMRQVESENAIRQHYRNERDRQIDAIVTRMDNEALKNQEEFEAKMDRLKEKYEKDIHQAESVERTLREKFNETRTRLAESDAQLRNSQAELKQLHIELDHSKKMCNEFLTEREQLRDNIRSEIATEVASIKSERDNEIQKIHKRVQQAIEKKDTTIELLQKENGALRERCIKLEAIIRQQRKDYCVK
ncbi:centrosomal protein of 131 kDa isoform X2 [Episyrphus balteatus]|uniref:centrosomal protein of 131 kDa isoform X2 n=1 Tax=Episyrphus balteatus TaxID=286459 RepID=UPI0024854A1C|nr:centrosomal protein of 131 kDa isoform X2 [Episyrphus balteatus]